MVNGSRLAIKSTIDNFIHHGMLDKEKEISKK